MKDHRAFVPAAGHDRWLSLYDPLTKLLGASAALSTLIEQAYPQAGVLKAGEHVLDIGCGTGTLAIMLKLRHSSIDVVAVDPDQKALDRAQRKSEQAGAPIHFVCGFGDAIPYPDASFDRVLSSFMLHHLTHDEKRATLHDVFRVLKPEGTFHILDFVSAGDRPRGVIARMLHADDHLTDSGEGRITAMLADVGFTSAAEVGARRTLFGPVSFYRAVRAPHSVG